MSSNVSFLIADDHVVLRAGLRALLGSVEGWEVIGEACDGKELVPLFQQLDPDLVIVDLSMPNLGGVDAIRHLKQLNGSSIVLILSAKDDDKSVQDAMRAGANGFVPKTSDTGELEFAIRSVLRGQTYLSPRVCEAMFGIRLNDSEARSPLAALTDREREVMKLLSEGKPNREVAKLLHISPRTVDSHRANIMKKLGVGSNAELVRAAVQYGLVE